MKHINILSTRRSLPKKADSLLERQQKVMIFSTFATAFGVFANSLGLWRDLIEGGGE